ncbi:Eco57I restriction-modification methylase domain-containing protein [Micromonospora sp. WMMC250]|uniref:Eco57I restriction-modification methylase domain-containing protein n=1 Tax=Micromonospora sp. WMMC250 TaxID=3014781 RepID=UPI0022B62BDB|nr:Eco57I restriction-modification methylase domain-containing protein [Micromonospora sp. WMMC250]MCZ7377241.1 Eco57I restriction-modification methylase domain-containing protein [Micromonospora sp. WMMC250]
MKAVAAEMRQLILGETLSSLTAIPAESVEHGEVFTRRWVVDLILDLAGYTADRDLAALVAVEPACGGGAFLAAMATRVSASCRKHDRPLLDAKQAIRAYDLLASNVTASRRLVREVLVDEGWSLPEAREVATAWLRQGDYLLDPHVQEDVDFVVGNPPYVRLEDVPADRMLAYRAACPTMTGRADLYVGFYERALRSLGPGGVLAFICADRWMRNQYGRQLRELISAGYSVDVTVTMHDVDAFEEQVSAYPAVTVVRRAGQGDAVVVDTRRGFGPQDAPELVESISATELTHRTNDRYEVARLPHWFSGGDSWPAGSPSRLALIDALNDRFPPLEDANTGTRVGIGVATGADSVFITTDADVEPRRLLPLSMVKDTTSGTHSWSGQYLVNPWDADGQLVDLAALPRLRAYYQRHTAALKRRHVASKRPAQWYRTIDKVDHSLIERPKLLLPDMKTTIHPVLDEGGFYPHHNLYYIVSDTWDLRVLGGLLLSDVAQAFVEAYAVRMRGGTLRFQAQYLRRIRVPGPETISAADRAALAAAFDERDTRAATEVALGVYGIEALEM